MTITKVLLGFDMWIKLSPQQQEYVKALVIDQAQRREQTTQYELYLDGLGRKCWLDTVQYNPWNYI